MASTQRVRLDVEDTGGSGRPVVLIHGWPLSAEAWNPQLGPLVQAGFRVIAYDRRGFGHSEKPAEGFDYDTLADDLAGLMDERDLRDASLVGFSMGGGEVARYVARHGPARLRSLVFAAAIPPFLLKTADNPDGPLTDDKARTKEAEYQQDREAYYERFTRSFYSANEQLMVSEAQRQQTLALCRQADPKAALGCMKALGRTDFRDDLRTITLPTLVLHGEADATVPLAGSGARTHKAVAHSELVTIPGAPHGFNLSHGDAFNAVLTRFLRDGTAGRAHDAV